MSTIPAPSRWTPRLATGLIAALVAALIALAPPAAAQTEQRIAAVINDDLVSVQDLIERIDMVVVTSGLEDTDDMRRELAPQVLRGMIDETLQLQEARRLGISVTDQEIRQALATVAQRNNMSPEALVAALAREGVSERTVLRQLEAQVAWLKIVAREIEPRVVVTQEQIDLALRELRQVQGQPQLLLSEIVLPVYEPAQEQMVLEDARRLVETARGGASFAALADQFSAAASGDVGGDVGWVPETALPPELRAAIAGMRPGAISDPIRAPGGFYIFQLRDRRVGGAAEVRLRLAQILFPVDGNGALALQQAAELRPRLTSCDAMESVATEIDAPMSGDLGWLRASDLPPGLASAVLALPEESVSEPLQGPGGIHLLMVCDRQETGTDAGLRDDVAEQLEREHVDRLVRRYLRDLRTEAFIDIRL
jgi:peptidyl-prolyl cis-trans isomerase SurA